MIRPNSRRAIGTLAAFIALATVGVAPVLWADQLTDQRHRDITRILSEVVHRAHSHALLGEVVRPEFASPTITLSAPNLHDGWVPSCDLQVVAEQSDPARNLQSLVLVPRDRVRQDGASFDAFAFIAGDFALTSADMTAPYPSWLVVETGGYASIERDIESLFSDLTVTVDTTACDGFSFYLITGERP